MERRGEVIEEARWARRRGLHGSVRSQGLPFEVYACRTLNYMTKSAVNVGVWLKRLGVLRNDDINVCDDRAFHICNTIA